MNPSVSPSFAVTCISPLVAFFKNVLNKLKTRIDYKIFQIKSILTNDEFVELNIEQWTPA